MKGPVYMQADYCKSSLSDDRLIADTPIDKVYEWVKTGQWKHKHFTRWLRSIRVIE